MPGSFWQAACSRSPSGPWPWSGCARARGARLWAWRELGLAQEPAREGDSLAAWGLRGDTSAAWSPSRRPRRIPTTPRAGAHRGRVGDGIVAWTGRAPGSAGSRAPVRVVSRRAPSGEAVGDVVRSTEHDHREAARRLVCDPPVAGFPLPGFPVAGFPVAGLPVSGFPGAGLPVRRRAGPGLDRLGIQRRGRRAWTLRRRGGSKLAVLLRGERLGDRAVRLREPWSWPRRPVAVAP